METPRGELGQKESGSLRTWALNPFHYVAGVHALVVGLVLVVATGVLGALSNSHQDGILDFHTGLVAPWWVFPCEGLINWLVLGILLFLAGLLVSRSRFRAVDVLGTQALARWPALLLGLVGLLPGLQRVAAQLPAILKGQVSFNQIKSEDLAQMAVAAVVIVIALVWMILLMYRAYAVSCNVSGTRGVVSFIVALLLGEVVSKLAIVGMLAGVLGSSALFGGQERASASAQGGPLVGTWRAVEFAKDLDGTDSGVADLWLKELEFKSDGTLTVDLSDGQHVDSLHTWHDMAVEWYGKTPNHPERASVELTLQNGRLFLPWQPQGTVVGYYVFEKDISGDGQAAAEPETSGSAALPQESVDNTSLVGTWRAVELARDLAGTTLGDEKPDIKELGLAPDGSVSMTFTDGKQTLYMHRWYEDMRIEWCANLPQGPRHLMEGLALQGGRLFIPYRSYAEQGGYGQERGYYVFEKTSDSSPALPMTNPAVTNPNSGVGTWQVVDLYEIPSGKCLGEKNSDVTELALASDGSAAVTYRDGRCATNLHRWHNDMRFEWCANEPTRPEHVMERIVIRDGHLFLPWRPLGESSTSHQMQGCYVFEKISDAEPGSARPGQVTASGRSGQAAGRNQAARPKTQQRMQDVPPPPLVGLWQAVAFAKDQSGTDSGIRDLWLREMEFRPDGGLSVAFGDGQVLHDLHRWQGMSIQWYANSPGHPERKTVKILFQGNRLFVPWQPQGRVVGYYVFEKPGYTPPAVGQAVETQAEGSGPPPPLQAQELSQEQMKLLGELETLQAKTQQCIKEGKLREARKLCEEASKRSEDDSALPTPPEWIAQTLAWLDLTEDPPSRFVIMGAVGAGQQSMLHIFDTRDGVEFKVKPGQEFAGFKLDSYDAESKTATISEPGQSHMILWR